MSSNPLAQLFGLQGGPKAPPPQGIADFKASTGLKYLLGTYSNPYSQGGQPQPMPMPPNPVGPPQAPVSNIMALLGNTGPVPPPNAPQPASNDISALLSQLTSGSSSSTAPPPSSNPYNQPLSGGTNSQLLASLSQNNPLALLLNAKGMGGVLPQQHVSQNQVNPQMVDQQILLDIQEQGGPNRDKETIYVTNLPSNITPAWLKETFSQFGPIKLDPKRGNEPAIRINSYVDKATNIPKCDAIIKYDDVMDAARAIYFFDAKHDLGLGLMLVRYANKKDNGPEKKYSDKYDRMPMERKPYPPRDMSSKPPPRGQAEVREGDWVCPDCQNVNFAFRQECRKCDKPKGNTAPIQSGYSPMNNYNPQPSYYNPEPQYSPQPSYPQPYSNDPNYSDLSRPPDNKQIRREGDWDCPSCGNHNFSRRESCNVCKASRFGGSRHGGGLQDRRRDRRTGPY